MEHWQKHERHHNQIEIVLKATGCTGKTGRIMRWHKHVWSILSGLGHTSLDYRKCNCCSLDEIERQVFIV